MGKQRQHEEERGKKKKEKTPENSAGTHPSCAITWGPPGDGWDFNWHGEGEAEERVRALGLVGKRSGRPWGDTHGTPWHMLAGRKLGIGSPEAVFGELFSPAENRRQHQHSPAGVLQIAPLRLWSSKLLS